ncbi:cell division protein FtsQ/DivIB [Candidatus Desulforudis audaxviator]|uniref:Polypeptide-transport-associated domain protein, FtsQ-type n=1 Tax=Desulforudis audaxviator (strain MP104C) TaxID=477974 RepID=B1I4E7_DESAP|nr:FtsQ-type POTRA domain-containing protein [Candidatus Desulforudis audaxviator]ACA59939.1 Polypeptide-transport-associated domain protein, FtsQ-type [Candidatus Desulforudis audaxviator MP104C]AZK59953.1 Cell division protein FtsQ [Candidatus Desulforudis audaxviator]
MPGPRLNWWETIIFSIIILVAGFILVSSPLFEIDTITVEGNLHLQAEEIRSASGIVPGTNIFQAQTREAEDRLEALPAIRKAELVREFPSTVRIIVEERVPVALLNIHGEFWEVDVEGVPVRKKGKGWDGLPVITGVQFGNPNLQRTLEAVEKLPKEVVAGLSEVWFGNDLRLILYTFDGIEIRLGQLERLEQKGVLLLEVLALVRDDGRKVEYIDLSEPDKPVVKYAGGGGDVEE